ncbi:MAG: AAA family ATPase [Smithella sp.]
MEYFNLLHFNKEPFSNSPEPEFLFAAEQHSSCLQMLELAVRLRRGLNVVIGDIGTGKTTLCRKLIQNLAVPSSADTPAIDTFLLLDPAVESPSVFLKTVAGIVGLSDIAPEDSDWSLKEKIKKFLFDKGVEEQRIIVLIIDEGQKIPGECLEILREFLNYETNSNKLLQIIIFAQPELEKSLAAKPNLLDRVNYMVHLRPLSFSQMRKMIEYRISVARQEMVKHPIFSLSGLLAVYFASAGYPRKVVSLCHQVLLKMIIQGKNKANWFLVGSCMGEMTGGIVYKRITWSVLSFLVLAALTLSIVFYLNEPMSPKNRAVVKNALSGILTQKEASVALAPAVLSTPEPADIGGSEGMTSDASKPASVDAGKALEKIPDSVLGTISIKGKMTLWWILENIYGETGKEITQQFAAANPRLKSSGNTQGVVIQVPLLRDKARPVKQDTVIVALDKSKNLEAVYHEFINVKDRANMPQLLLLSLLNRREGRQFLIALNQKFTTVQEAQAAVNRLPLEFAARAQVLSKWDADTILFNRKYALEKKSNERRAMSNEQ